VWRVCATWGCVTLHLIGGGKPVHVSIGMFPFDLRTFSAVGGMPECAWMCWASAQITRYYEPSAGYSMMLSTQAKRPGPQAGLEKGLAGAFGVMTGCPPHVPLERSRNDARSGNGIDR